LPRSTAGGPALDARRASALSPIRRRSSSDERPASALPLPPAEVDDAGEKDDDEDLARGARRGGHRMRREGHDEHRTRHQHERTGLPREHERYGRERRLGRRDERRLERRDVD
jgi:hypothetical protein